jgi:glutaredoxin 3
MSVLIFGKDSCPYTQAALDHHRRRDPDLEYVRVTGSPQALARMLEHSGGKRRVPVIVEDGKVTIGFGGT